MKRKPSNLSDIAKTIKEKNPWETGDVCFMPRELILTTLPHSDIEGSEYKRVNGNHTLSILAPSDIGLPWGSKARSIICWITTEAKKTGQPELTLGRSFKDFMKKSGIGNPTGGKNGNLQQTKDQLQKLFSATISVHTKSRIKTSEHGFRIADKHSIWWKQNTLNTSSCGKITVTLSPTFFREAVTNAVPLDLRVLRAFKRSLLAFDIYCWLTYRFYNLKEDQVSIPWDSLYAQFGANYKTLREFRRQFNTALDKVYVLYPDANFETTQEHLILKPSPTHVPKAPKKPIWLINSTPLYVENKKAM